MLHGNPTPSNFLVRHHHSHDKLQGEWVKLLTLNYSQSMINRDQADDGTDEQCLVELDRTAKDKEVKVFVVRFWRLVNNIGSKILPSCCIFAIKLDSHINKKISNGV
jgi:hypothetical protein